MSGCIARVLILGWLLVMGCATSEVNNIEREAKSEAFVVGFLHLESKGPYFRRHQTEAQVRFFDVKNEETGKLTRISMTESTKRFVTRLSPGHYHVLRIQIGEGPFRSESYTDMNFEVFPDKTNYLGIWRLRVDAPKTVRMLQLDVFSEVLNWEPLLVLHPELGEKALMVSIPQPDTNQSRLFCGRSFPSLEPSTFIGDDRAKIIRTFFPEKKSSGILEKKNELFNEKAINFT